MERVRRASTAFTVGLLAVAVGVGLTFLAPHVGAANVLGVVTMGMFGVAAIALVWAGARLIDRRP